MEVATITHVDGPMMSADEVLLIALLITLVLYARLFFASFQI